MSCTCRLSGCLAALALLLLYVSSSVAETRICLNMIAKDEAKEIMSCLEPLAPELSGWTLCDTGSTDDTVQIVEDFFEKQSIPGLAATHAWQDFGHNRNLCIQEGMDWSLQEAKRQGMPLGSHYCDYLLFLDADQLLSRPAGMEPGALKRMDLAGDGYHMTEKGVGVTYKNLRLVSTRLDWEWLGEVHEYVHRKDGRHHAQQDIDGLWFNHDASGGQEGKRFVRDEVILAKAVSQRPADPRARFYYANTLRALNRDEEAITQYLMRIKLGGWAEERFMSALNIADLTKRHWEAGKLISAQVQQSVSNFESHDMRLHPDAEEAEEAQIETARDALKVATDAARAKLDAAKADSISSSGDQGPSGTKEAGKDTDSAKENKYSQAQLMADPDVKQAANVVQKLVQARQHRQFHLLVSAYMAAIAILPYRPEPWVHLARLHRMEKGDNQKCYSYAAAGLAQGPARREALFLNTNHASYELLDEVCACAYYVESAVDEGRRACKKLVQKLSADLQMFPNNDYLSSMLSRVKGNMGWYVKKVPEESLDEGECPSAAEARLKHKEAAVSTA